MEHERCSIYSPSEITQRAPKRQRVSKPNLTAHPHLAERLSTYREIWTQQEERIQNTLEDADRTTQEGIVNFISGVPEIDRRAIPSGLVVAGPSIASYASFFARLGERIREQNDSAYLVLTSGECPNLKTLLKNLIRKATSRVEEDDDDDLAPTRSSRNGPKLLDFDLGHLHEWLGRNAVKNVVVAIQDSEAFDARVLDEMIDLFSAWLDRIPFILLFGIATSAESFEDRLSGKTLRYLEGRKFDVTQSDEIIEKLFGATIASADLPLRIGPNIARRIMDRQKDHVQNTQDFSDGLKYAHMSQFYASYPSIFLKNKISFGDVDSDAFEALRNLPSFRRWIEAKVENKETREIRELLNSDEHLFNSTLHEIQAGRYSLNTLSCAAQLIAQIRASLQMSPNTRLSTIWIRAASSDLLGSPLLRETMLSMKKISSDKLTRLLPDLERFNRSPFNIAVDIAKYQKELKQLVAANTDSKPLRSHHDVGNENVRTTVVAQKVLLSRHKATLSEKDKVYSDLVTRFHEELEGFLESALIDPKELFPSEILMYDFTSPHTEVFQPRPRFAIERALAGPHDYLGCDCCGAGGDHGGEGEWATTQPATAILYQLYLESGALINVSDLWSAFNAMVGEEDEESQSRTMALFQRALAELRYLGFVKPSRKKTDHIAKTMWKGL